MAEFKKEWYNAICSTKDGSEDCHTEWSKSEREGEIWYLLYVESKEKWYKWTYLQIRYRLIALENEFMIAGREGWGERIVREFGKDMCTLLYFKWVTKDPLYSTVISSQCYVAAWVGGESGRMGMYTYGWVSLFFTETFTQLLIGYVCVC